MDILTNNLGNCTTLKPFLVFLIKILVNLLLISKKKIIHAKIILNSEVLSSCFYLMQMLQGVIISVYDQLSSNFPVIKHKETFIHFCLSGTPPWATRRRCMSTSCRTSSRATWCATRPQTEPPPRWRRWRPGWLPGTASPWPASPTAATGCSTSRSGRSRVHSLRSHLSDSCSCCLVWSWPRC